MPRRASIRPTGLAAALAAAVACVERGASRETIARAEKALLGHLCAIAGHAGGRKKRGRPPLHDQEWAVDQIQALAASVDGVPDEQSAVVIWLEDRFRSTDRAVPSETWLKNVEKEFRKRSENRTREMRLKYQSSPTLQGTWRTEEDYLTICAQREKKAREWLHSRELRRRYKTPGDYFLAVVSEQENGEEAA